MNFSIRIKELRVHKKLTQKELSDLFNVDTSTVGKWERLGTIPNDDTLKKLSAFFNVSIDYLLGNQETKKIGIKIPVLGVIPAGVPIEAIEDILDYEEIDSKLAATGSFFALKIKGDSMSPQLQENDIVIIKQQQDFNNNDTCAVIVNGFDATLKRVKKDETGLWLIPNNSAHQSQFYPASDVQSLPVKVIGKAIEIRRSL